MRPCLTIAGALLFLTIDTLSAATYHVSPAPSGSDDANGSSGAPWATLQHAIDNITAGDTVVVHPGTYKGFAMGEEICGTKARPITIKAEAGAIINDKNSVTADGINLEGASFIIIDGFTIKNTKGVITRAGIRAVIDTGVVIRNNTIDSCGTWGIFTGFSENIIIENNRASRSVQQHGIYFSNSADNPIIRGNVSFGNSGCGIHMNGDESMGGDGIISRALVAGNVIYDNGRSGGSGINCDGVQNSRIQNNLLYNNHASGISLFMGDGAEGAKNDTVMNNTILEAADARWCLNIKVGSTGSVVMNNILFNYHSWHGSISVDAESMSGLKSDYNVVMDRLTPDDDNTVMTLAAWRTATGQDGHSIIATPEQLFVNVAAGDYHSKSSSPAIDAGTAQFAPVKDIAGTDRPVNSKFDIGAYEFSTSFVVAPFVNRTNSVYYTVGQSGVKIMTVDLAGRVFNSRVPTGINGNFRKLIFVKILR